MKFIHLLLSNLIGQNVQAMVQVIYSPPILQPDWSEVTSQGTKSISPIDKSTDYSRNCTLTIATRHTLH